MNINRQVDIEDEIRLALTDYFEAYCRPLPDKYGLPNVLVEQTGGTTLNTVDTFQIKLSVRAKTDADAIDTMRDVLGVLEYQAEHQFGALRHISINSLASWGNDPARPDLKLCTMTAIVIAHREEYEITTRRN
ncbi:MAG: hypothetical protein IIY21_02500 [Clostridiales bacterium]|nr:hypothetical protein [Clostridiales bacterium]MBQ1570927.1 hypothetical protein [Clostridiales bacterium]